MLRFLFVILPLCSLSNTAYTQSDQASVTVPDPFLLSKETLSGVGLRKIDLKDQPDKVIHQKRLVRGDELSVYVVSSQSWTNEIEQYSFDEYVFLLHGMAVARPASGNAQEFYTGQHFFAPKGFKGEWEVVAGSNLHYELSVISTHRSDSSQGAVTDFALIEPEQLSGHHIVFDSEGLYENIMAAGSELTVSICAEQLREVAITNPLPESILYIQAGQLTLDNKESTTGSTTYHTGDFVFIPKGYTGQWKSEGLDLLKFVKVTASSTN